MEIVIAELDLERNAITPFLPEEETNTRALAWTINICMITKAVVTKIWKMGG